MMARNAKAAFYYDWIFMHDPDHRVMPELRRELAEVFSAGVPADVDGFYVRRRNVFQGKWIQHGGYYPVDMLKIVRHGRVSFDEHEFDYRAYVPGRPVKLKHDIIEENVKEENITFWIDKHNYFGQPPGGGGSFSRGQPVELEGEAVVFRESGSADSVAED